MTDRERQENTSWRYHPQKIPSWFARLVSESSAHLSLPMHRQVLVQDDKTKVQHGEEGLLVVSPLGGTSLEVVAPKFQQDQDGNVIKPPVYTILNLKAKHLAYNNRYITVVNNYMICVNHSRTCYIFNPRNMKVEKIASLPHDYFIQSMPLSDKDVFVITCKYHDVEDHIVCTHVMKYNFQDNQWAQLTILPEAFNHVDFLDGCIYQDTMYIIGKGTNINIFVSVDTVSGDTTILPHVIDSDNINLRNGQIISETGDEQYEFELESQKWKKCVNQQEPFSFFIDKKSFVSSINSEFTFELIDVYRDVPIQDVERLRSCKLTFPEIPDTCINEN